MHSTAELLKEEVQRRQGRWFVCTKGVLESTIFVNLIPPTAIV